MIARLLRRIRGRLHRPRKRKLKVNDWSGLTREKRLYIKAHLLGAAIPRCTHPDKDGKIRYEILSEKDDEGD